MRDDSMSRRDARGLDSGDGVVRHAARRADGAERHEPEFGDGDDAFELQRQARAGAGGQLGTRGVIGADASRSTPT